MEDYNYLLDETIKCECGKSHYASIKYVDFNFKPENILEYSNQIFNGNKILVVSDIHTYYQQTKDIFKVLDNSKYIYKSIIFKPKGKLIPDEKAVGRILMHTERDLSGLIAIGSGTINDLVRFVGSRIKVPVITVATAPSMDGYASAGSSLMVNGKKKTLKGKPVKAILGSLSVLKNAPYDLIQSGFGDIIGKRTALSDWVLAGFVKNEYTCDLIMDLVSKSTDICITNATQIAQREKDAIGYLINALTLSGITMSLADDTRPASGSEHLISHYLVMKAIEKGEQPPYHGISVALGTLISTMLYRYMLCTEKFNSFSYSRVLKAKLNKYLPECEDVIKWLEIIGLPQNPLDYGVNKNLLIETLYNAGNIRDRYTIFKYLEENDMLDGAVKYIIDKFDI